MLKSHENSSCDSNRKQASMVSTSNFKRYEVGKAKIVLRKTKKAKNTCKNKRKQPIMLPSTKSSQNTAVMKISSTTSLLNSHLNPATSSSVVS